MRFTNLLFSLFALFLATSAFSNRIYLDYDSGCMDVYEYHLMGENSGKIQLVYHIKLNDREKVILEAVVDKDIRLPKKPANTRSCSDLSINERTVRQINSGDLDLYILRKKGKNYNVSLVRIASYGQVSSTVTGYSMKDARFSYKFSQPANGIDLAANGSNSSIYFKGTLSHECPKKYLFTKSSSNGERNYTEFVLIPEIGIIEQKSGINENDAKNNVKQLKRINGQNVNDYVQKYCESMRNNGAGKFYSGGIGTVDNLAGGKNPSNEQLDTIIFRKPGGNNNTNTTGNTNVVTSTPGDKFSGLSCTFYKDIDKGLYFDWQTGGLANGYCGGREYRNGYVVGSPTVVTTTPTTTTVVTQPPVIVNPAPPVTNFSECANQSRYGVHVVQRNETLYGIARIYGVSHKDLQRWNRLSSNGLIKPCMQLLTRAPQTEAAPIETDYKAQYHTVKRNETLYGISRKYGYTVDRLRKMNGIGDSDNLYVGQQIKVSDCNCPADAVAPVAFSERADNIPTAFEATSSRIDTGTTTSSKRRFHVVKENDTIYSIAKKYNISVASLRAVNDLEENEIIIPYQRIYLEN